MIPSVSKSPYCWNLVATLIALSPADALSSACGQRRTPEFAWRTPCLENTLLGLLLSLLCYSLPVVLRAPEVPPAAEGDAEDPKAEEAAAAPEEIKVYDLVKEDITQIPDLTSRNLSVMGVKLGDRTAEVNQNKQLGKPLGTTPVGGLYRSAYQERGIYLDIDKQTGKVMAIYVNTTLARKVKGRFRSILAAGQPGTVQEDVRSGASPSPTGSSDHKLALSQKGRGADSDQERRTEDLHLQAGETPKGLNRSPAPPCCADHSRKNVQSSTETNHE